MNKSQFCRGAIMICIACAAFFAGALSTLLWAAVFSLMLLAGLFLVGTSSRGYSLPASKIKKGLVYAVSLDDGGSFDDKYRLLAKNFKETDYLWYKDVRINWRYWRTLEKFPNILKVEFEGDVKIIPLEDGAIKGNLFYFDKMPMEFKLGEIYKFHQFIEQSEDEIDNTRMIIAKNTNHMEWNLKKAKIFYVPRETYPLEYFTVVKIWNGEIVLLRLSEPLLRD